MDESLLHKLVYYKMALDINSVKDNTEQSLKVQINNNDHLKEISSQMSEATQATKLILVNQIKEIKHREQQQYCKNIVFNICKNLDILCDLGDAELCAYLVNKYYDKAMYHINYSVQHLVEINDKEYAYTVKQRLAELMTKVIDAKIDVNSTVFAKFENAADNYNINNKLVYDMSTNLVKLKDITGLRRELEHLSVDHIKYIEQPIKTPDEIRATLKTIFILMLVCGLLLLIGLVPVFVISELILIYLAKGTYKRLRNYNTYVSETRLNNEKEENRVKEANREVKHNYANKVAEVNQKINIIINENADIEAKNAIILRDIEIAKDKLSKHNIYIIKREIDNRCSNFEMLMDMISDFSTNSSQSKYKYKYAEVSIY